MSSFNHANDTAQGNASPPSAAATPTLGVGPLPLDAGEFRRQGRQVVDFIADYYDRIDEYPVRPAVAPGFLARQLPDTAPAWPEPDALASALRDVRELILPGVTHWQSPRHFARFGLVCFRLRPAADDGTAEATNELNRRLLETVNATGRAYMSCAVVGGMYLLRCAVGNSLTEERHVREAWSVVQQQADAVLALAAAGTAATSKERTVQEARRMETTVHEKWRSPPHTAYHVIRSYRVGFPLG